MEEAKNIAKKVIIVYILNVIKAYSSPEAPISQTAICNYLNDIDVPCDRKTVCRNIKFLKEMGYPIIKTTKGFYMDNKLFSVEEIEFIKSAILSKDEKTREERESLSNKVAELLTKKYS